MVALWNQQPKEGAMTSVNLDLSKLLGFRILDTADVTAMSLGSKTGNKLGEKAGIKEGAKDI